MNTNHRRVQTDFGPEARFEITLDPPAPFRAMQESLFEKLKTRLVTERLEEVWGPEISSHVRRAANDAAALAWVTPYPLLVFPSLFQEKTESALLWADRQKQVRARSCEFVAL
jgi:hypothetical protein